jgi:microcystin-dependent protein
VSTLRVNSVSNLSGNDLTVPPGAVQFFARNTAPNGWVKANGAALSRSTYADLFTAIGTAFGVGDGSTTFTLPDMRGEFPRGWDDGRGIDSGRVFGNTQTDALQNMTGRADGYTSQSFSSRNFGGGTGVFTTTQTSTDASAPSGQTTTVNGGALLFDASRVARTSTETRPRNIAFLACIKY